MSIKRPFAAAESKDGAQKKTEGALASLRQSAQDFQARLDDLNRRCEDCTTEVRPSAQSAQSVGSLVSLVVYRISAC